MTFYFDAEIIEGNIEELLSIIESTTKTLFYQKESYCLSLFPDEKGYLRTFSFHKDVPLHLSSFVDTLSTLEEAKEYYQPIIKALEIYGYCEYRICDEFGKLNEKEVFVPTYEFVWRDLSLQRYQKHFFSKFIVGKVDEEKRGKANLVFSKYVKNRKETMMAYHKEDEPFIRYIPYESFSYLLYLLILSSLTSNKTMKNISEEYNLPISNNLIKTLENYF